MNLEKNNSQKYEYAFEAVSDKLGGGVNLDGIMTVTNEKIRNGWRLITVFTNELGKNAISVGGIGVNSTLDQAILVFEREIKQEAVSLFNAEAHILESNIVTPFVPKVATFFEKNGSIYVILRVFSRQDFDLKGLQGDLIVRNVFGDEIKLEDVCFFSFEKNREGYLVSSPFPVTLPDKVSYGVSSAGLSVKRYIGNDKLEILQDTDISSIAEARISNAGSLNIDTFHMETECLHNAAEIYNYVQEISERKPGVFSDELLYELDQLVKMERCYGNMKSSAIKKLDIYYDSMGMK